MRYLIIIVGAVLVNNFVLNRFLGCCPFLGVSKKTETALGMSGAVVFVMTVASAVTWCLDHWLLAPLGLGYIHTLAFILVIASLVQFIDIAMKRFVPPLHAAPRRARHLPAAHHHELRRPGRGGAELQERHAVHRIRALLLRRRARLRLRARHLLRPPRKARVGGPAPLLPRHRRGARHGRAPLPRLHGLQRPWASTASSNSPTNTHP